MPLNWGVVIFGVMKMQNTEYPKMLYSGDKESYSSRIIHSAEEEAQFREIGLIDYADLPEPEPEESAPSEVPQGFVMTEQFDAVAERLAAAEKEIERLKNPEPFEPEMKYASSGSTAPQTVDYNLMTSEQLRAVLDEKGIKYLARDLKADLLAYLG